MGIHKYVLQSMIQSVAEKNDYETSAMIRAQRQSIVFNNEFENIHTDYIDHFAEKRR